MVSVMEGQPMVKHPSDYSFAACIRVAYNWSQVSLVLFSPPIIKTEVQFKIFNVDSERRISLCIRFF